ncbi:adhesive plaque matrix protein-like isoform X2 [Nilaparvata lugens]|uniref:adhesive plaque matrix protein-like isoform X2 n=1 Tax=Nilaparvata lugens TaxID=108931 RepID=UPI00193D9BFF|nr:adhesive plaque matrix protein-like isoform X2 [Nilaparvata lugens]
MTLEMFSSRPCFWAVALILIATACQVNSKVPPKFIRATRGASKAIYGTRSGYPIFSGPRKVVVGSTSLKREIGSPPSGFPSSHGRRVRRRKTVKRAKKPSRRPSSYSAYGLPVYAKKYKYYVPSRPVRYKTRPKPVARLKLRIPTYTQLQDPDDYEEEDKPYMPDETYDYFDEPKPQVMSITPIKPRPRPVITVIHKKKKKKRIKISKPKSTTPRTEDDDEDTRGHEDEDEDEDEGYHRKPSSKPHRYHGEEHRHKYTHDSDGSYTQTPNYKEPPKFIPPYIMTSNTYGGGAEHNHAYQNHGYYTQMPPQYSPPPYTPPSFTPQAYYPSPTYNPHQYRATGPADTDIGFGQGMEYVADKNPSPWK